MIAEDRIVECRYVEFVKNVLVDSVYFDGFVDVKIGNKVGDEFKNYFAIGKKVVVVFLFEFLVDAFEDIRDFLDIFFIDALLS